MQVKSINVNVGPFLATAAKMERERERLNGYIMEMLKECTTGWQDSEMDDITITQLGGAMTNLLFLCSKPAGENKDVIVRIYGEGTESFFARTEEIQAFEMLSQKNVGVKLLGQFENGRVEKFIEGETCTSKMIREPETSKKIAATMRKFHEMEMDVDKSPTILASIHKFLETAKEMCTSEKFASLDFEEVGKCVNDLEARLALVNSPVVYCHNDLQYGNIMRTKSNEIVLIDFEYSSYNNRGYDFGNHFCEWAYDYHKSVNPHLGDFSKYPTKEEQERFITAYLQDGDESVKVDAKEVESIRLEANTYSLASHLFWALWGFIQASQSQIDFDFFEYGMCRYNAFLSKCTLRN